MEQGNSAGFARTPEPQIYLIARDARQNAEKARASMLAARHVNHLSRQPQKPAHTVYWYIIAQFAIMPFVLWIYS